MIGLKLTSCEFCSEAPAPFLVQHQGPNVMELVDTTGILRRDDRLNAKGLQGLAQTDLSHMYLPSTQLVTYTAWDPCHPGGNLSLVAPLRVTEESEHQWESDWRL